MTWNEWQIALPHLMRAWGMTIYVAIAGALVGCAVGLALCVVRASGSRILSGLVALYVSFFRGVPLLVQMLLFYNFLPFVGIDLTASASAIGALSLVGAAYIAEIFRGSLSAINPGQVEAATAFGFAPATIWQSILIPQVFRIAMPALVNELILLVKASSLISVVGLAEVTRVSQTFAASTYRPMEFYLAAGAIYLVTNMAIAFAGTALERRLQKGGR